MDNKIFKLNSIPFLWISGIALTTSFILEYVFPFFSISFLYVINPAWISILISGTPLVYLALQAMIERKITSPILITIAMIAAIYIGDIFAAGEIAFIMAIGEFLEDKTVEKAKKGIENLLNLVPTQARLIEKNQESMIDIEEIKINNILRVLPGESFPADGIIIEGNTTVEQSILTGESLPVDKVVNDEVFAGTMNCFGSVDIKVSKSFANSSLQKMIKLVEEADNQKAPTQKIVDKWAGYLVPLACVIAIITYFIFAFSLDRKEDALIRGVTILVVFCPCALALATPTSIMAAIAQGTKNGVLIKSGEALEKMGEVTTVCLDKTGTLTQGKLKVSDIKIYVGDQDTLIKLVSGVESRSEHPIGKAIVTYAKEKEIEPEVVSEFKVFVGKGVCAQVENDIIFCGNEKLIKDNAKLKITKEMEEQIESLREEGKAILIITNTQRVMAIIGLWDELKENAKSTINELKVVGIKEVFLLTGDNEKSAKFIASKVGIGQIYSSLLPEDTVRKIQELSQGEKDVCMVGDGVNDAPSLKIASVGIAMGTIGSDIAIDAADIAIMGDDLSKIAYIKKLSNATIFSIKFNIILSMIINVVAIILSVTGYLTPTTGALVHNAGSVFVVLNAARLYDKKIE